jgi:hypothetical protein
MRRGRIVTHPSHAVHHDAGMDVVAIVIGIAMFAILLAMVAGIDKI